MQEVIVTVVGTQRRLDGEEDVIELIAKGHRRQNNGVTYITYKEEVSGLDGAITLLKLYSDHVSLVRMGAYEQKQEFYPGHKTYSLYSTPYGSMELGVLTRELSLENTQGENLISDQFLWLAYELDIDGEWQSSNTLKISVQEANQEKSPLIEKTIDWRVH